MSCRARACFVLLFVAAFLHAPAAEVQPTTVKAVDFWSLKPLQKTTLPRIKNNSWAKTPIDAFILAKLEEQKMKPSRPAEKRDLLRRATFDLTGLPPTPEEMRDF